MRYRIDTEARLAPWRDAWPRALAAWSPYTRLREPTLCATTFAAAREGLHGSFAMIRLADQCIVIDLAAVRRHGLDGFETEILAHEIGHHVLAPASVTDHLRLLARMRRALPTLERHAPMVANLYTDLFINDRLQRQAGLRMAGIYEVLAQRDGPSGKVWQLYMGICEELWQCKGRLGGGRDPALAADAWLGARLIRVFANDWLDGAGRFAMLLLPHLVDDAAVPAGLMDTLAAGAGADPSGAIGIDDDEDAGAVHPARDPRISGLDEEDAPARDSAKGRGKERGKERGKKREGKDGTPGRQAREPFEYGEMLRAAGLAITDGEMAIRYYRERALPHVVPFPTRPAPRAPDPQPEGLEPWHLGESIEAIDWLHTLALSPRPVPGVTTLQRTYGGEPAATARPVPMDLDLFVDSSGSMPDPRVAVSWLALAGAVIALSALRAGASVRVTLWSGTHQVLETDGFTRDERAILAVLTDYFGGSTAFPIHRLRETYCGSHLRPKPRSRPTHLLMISDDGIDTMFADDELGHSGWEVAAAALRAAGGGGSMALNLPANGAGKTDPLAGHEVLRRAAREQGWHISAIGRMEDLLEFARAFSRRHYAAGGGGR